MQDEIFQFQHERMIAVKGRPGAYAKIHIEATDRKALIKVLRDMMQADKSGTIRSIFEQATLTTVHNHN